MADDVFEADWLALREPVDHRSRSAGLVDALLAARDADALRSVVDLGGGTGSNLRYLAPRLPALREWTVVDHDPGLLSRTEAPEGVTLRCVAGDLREEGLAEAAGVDLVTASALLDLVTRSWLAELATVCAGSGTPLLLALSYDGTVRWRKPAVPAATGPGELLDDDEDRFVAEAVNRHQAGPKGMGTALGPEAWRAAAELLEAAGYRVRVVSTPWILAGEADAPLAAALVDGWVEAACQLHPDQAARIRSWGDRRVADLRAGRVAVEVGHRDLLALPGTGRAVPGDRGPAEAGS